MFRLILSFSLALLSHVYLLQYDLSILDPAPPQLISDNSVTVTLNQYEEHQKTSPIQETIEQQPQEPPAEVKSPKPPPQKTRPENTFPAQQEITPRPQSITPQAHKLTKITTPSPGQEFLLNTTDMVQKDIKQAALPAVTPSLATIAEETTPSPQAVSTPQVAASSVIKARPMYQHNPKPEYPNLARRRGWEGTVLLLVEVTEKGQVTSVKLQNSCGYTILDKAARKAVKNWRFLAGTAGGRPVTSAILIPVHFKLHDPS